MTKNPPVSPRPPVRVGFVIDALAPGAGTENQLILLLRHLDRTRVEPRLCCLWENQGLRELQLDPPPEVLGFHRLASGAGVRGLARLRRWVREERLDLVVTFFRDANIVGTLGARWAGVPVLSNRRNMGYWHNRREVYGLRVLNRMAARLVANSEAVREHAIRAEGVPGEKVDVVYNAIDVERFRPPGEGEATAGRTRMGLPLAALLIGCVANLRPVKGHGFLITSFASVRRRLPDARLVLVGEGSEEHRLRSLAQALGVAGDVIFLGPRRDTSELLQCFDLVVLPSTSEGLSNALLEALATGVACAATDVGGNPELLGYGSLGKLVPSGDVKAMGDALLGLALDPELRRELGDASRRHVLLNFSVPVVLEAWHRLLESVARPTPS